MLEMTNNSENWMSGSKTVTTFISLYHSLEYLLTFFWGQKSRENDRK